MTPPVVRLTQVLMSCWVCFLGRKMIGVRDSKRRCWAAANEIMWWNRNLDELPC